MAEKERILVVDADPDARNTLHRVLTRNGYDVRTAENGTDAIERLLAEPFGLVISDLFTNPMDGFEILSTAKKIDPATEVIFMTGQASIDTAVEAIKREAFDYLEKPVLPTVIHKRVAQALEKRRQCRPAPNPSRGAGDATAQIIGKGLEIQKIKRLVRQIALSDANVLITGESGTGKELVARAIHQASHRCDKGFFPVNCGALTDALLTNELFGHEKDAYTGATTAQPGLLEHADGGTLFLDEVGDMSVSMQSKLLRVVQERELLRVGGRKPVRIDIRIISATNKDLKQAMERGAFREDLYYRLNIVPIHMPSMEARREDIPLLADYFLKRLAEKFQRPITGFSKEAMTLLCTYHFPGNIRELENIIERAVALAGADTIDVEDLPEELRNIEVFTIDRPRSGIKSLSEMEREYILWVLDQCGHSKQRAAELLGINRVSLYRKLKKIQFCD